ncbi:unnamed protein product [Prorocentrum cordatum]|uniref:Peptidase A2 domain-containing protein n=1 Tax=Prorocentrum cordatum TaxID=2364126 RepID=A0ABN9W548_9DINO|nr:unnamed protein product [Polarella glacialis]
MVDSGAKYSACPRSFAPGAPNEKIGNELDIVAATGQRIDIDERVTVTTTGVNVNGQAYEQQAKYLVGNVRQPVRAVADIIDNSGYENQFFDASQLASHELGDVDVIQGDAPEVPGGEETLRRCDVQVQDEPKMSLMYDERSFE